MKYLTKKITLLSSIVVLIGAIVYADLLTRLCKESYVCGSLYWSYFWSGTVPWTMITIFLLVFPFSLITLPLPNVVFEAWKRFAVWGVPLVSVLASLWITSEQAHSNGFFDFGFGPIVLGFLYGVFMIISFVIIVKSWIRARRAFKKGKSN